MSYLFVYLKKVVLESFDFIKIHLHLFFLTIWKLLIQFNSLN